MKTPNKTAQKKPPASAARPALRRRARLTSLSEQVLEELRRQIIHGERKPEERLVELEIAATMGVSQGTVREALQRLESDGLVERQSRTATYVSAASLDEMYELSMVRKQVEEFAFRRAARAVTPTDCERLQGLVEQMRAAGRQGDVVAIESLDLEFHRTICELSGSKALLRVWLPLFAQLQRFIVEAHYRYFPSVAEIAEGHQPLVDALRTGNPDKAAAALHEHVMISWSRINSEQPAGPQRLNGGRRGKARR